MTDDTVVHGLHIDSDGLYMGVSGEAPRAMAEMLADQFKRGGGINYIEMRFESKEVCPGEWFVVTVQKVGGQTAHQLRAAAEAEAERLRAELAIATRDALEAKQDVRDLLGLKEDNKQLRAALPALLEDAERGRNIRDYGRQCVEDYKKSLKPVAWAVCSSLGTVWNTTHKVEEAGVWQRASHGGLTSVVPLYRLDEEQTR